MRILVDLLGFTGHRGGTESYARELLARLPQALPGVDFHAISGRAGTDEVRRFFPGPVDRLDWVDAGRSRWAAAEVVSVERSARRVGADAIWSPSNFGPLRAGLPRLVSIHDVIYHEVGRNSPTRALTSWLMTRSARSASHVLTVSHAAARSIETHMGIGREKISVVHNGCRAPSTSPTDPWALVRALGVTPGREIVLSIGNRMPHKNFGGLLRSLAALPPDQRPLAVLPGGRSADPLSSAVTALGLERDAILPGWVTAAQLEALYSIADLYVCPSLTEGFGLPVVDALRRGCAVLANDVDVLREVGGTVTSYADAGDVLTFAREIRACLDAPTRRGDVQARIAWAQQFSWDAAANGTADALRSVLESPRAGRKRRRS